MRDWRRLLAVGLPILVALATRLPRLGDPEVFVFDEVFYANDALDVAEYGVEQGAARHPSGGKWIIASGIRIFGFSPIGWRVGALAAGLLVVAFAGLLAWQLSLSTRATLGAGLLVALDGVAYTTGRLALLDGFVALWSTLAVLSAMKWANNPRAARRFLHIALGACGLAVATKWSAVPVAVSVMVALGAVALRRERIKDIVAVILIPPATYVMVHLGWLIDGPPSVLCAGRSGCGLLDTPAMFIRHQIDMIDFHLTLDRDNAELARGWKWPFGVDPTTLYERGSASIVARTNPVVWLVGGAAAVRSLMVRRRGRLPSAGSALVSVTIVLAWLPWLAQPSFTFYAAPLVPLLAALGSAEVARTTGRSALVWFAAVSWFVWAFPTLSAA